ncbi:HET-domain-containing protein, partial [Polyplosphaeria fusca]
PPFYPLRLLDVGADLNSTVVLRESRTFNDDEPYICLSHCWGQSKILKLTKETHLSLRNGLSMSGLPKTFQDAVYVARYFHIRYLWIDSLCIFQDDNADWSVESSRMGNIYRHAVCTIAATASINSDGGLFFDRNPSPPPLLIEVSTGPIHTPGAGRVHSYPLAGQYWCDELRMCTKHIDDAPLNFRAWVAQERLLSRRTLHFGDRQLFWECNENRACETYPDGLPEWALPADDSIQLKPILQNVVPFQSLRDDKGAVSLNRETEQDDGWYRPWLSFRWNYSRCDLTKNRDKLVALRGITQLLGDAIRDEFVAGLWRSRIIEELCWLKVLRFGENTSLELGKWRAPTWSWASSNAEI